MSDPFADDFLTEAQKVFVMEFIKCKRNATRAYMVAYPDASYHTASREGPSLMRVPKIAAEIALQSRLRLARMEVEAEQVLQDLKDTIREARENKDFGAAISGLKALGLEAGLFKKQVEHTGAGGGPIETQHQVVFFLPENTRPLTSPEEVIDVAALPEPSE